MGKSGRETERFFVKFSMKVFNEVFNEGSALNGKNTCSIEEKLRSPL